MTHRAFALTVLFFLAEFYAGAAGQENIRLTRIEGQLVFDGNPSESLWNTLTKFDLTMHRPDFGTQPSELSEIRIGYDNQFLWIGASLYMRDASKIFAASKKRDEELFNYDAFGIILDTYNDNENGLAFFTTPTGLRTDYTISNDAQESGTNPSVNPSMNFSWNTFWDVKTTRDNKGWYIEMRIPFSSLKFKPENDIAVMGIIVSRILSSNNEADTYPAIDPKYGPYSTSKPSLAQTIEISGARPSRPVYVSPYIITGISRDWYMNDSETGYFKRDDPDYNAGIDLKYNINSNLTVDLTTNTDFAQVEADDQQVNLTRYSLFFPEKRVFFQERSSLFDFSLGGHYDNLFYSRNIGISNGEPVKILGGARLTGRIGKWDMGFMDMQTGEHRKTPGENYGVLRMRRQVINSNTYIGGIFTSRLTMDGNRNMAYGVDGIFRLFGDDYLNVKLVQTSDNNITGRMSILDPSFMLFSWQRRSEKGFAYDLNYTYSGQKFNPGVGFVRIGGVQGINARFMYGWIPGEDSRLFNYKINVGCEKYNRLQDGEPESFRIAPEFEINTKKGYNSSISLEIQQEGVLLDFWLSDSVKIISGNYSFTGVEIRVGSPKSKIISLESEINAGQFYDGERFRINTTSNFNLSSSFRLSAIYEFNAIRFNERMSNNSVDIHALNLKALYMFSTKLSASLLLQFVNTDEEMITNLRLRYNPREGNDLYLVFNNFRGLEREAHSPALPPFFNRTIMAKYTHTFIL